MLVDHDVLRCRSLPAAIPLFATGIGGLGLLGWRRKRPLPGALPLAATGFGLLGLLGWRRKRKSTTSVLAA
jgi:hypothetical protein